MDHRIEKVGSLFRGLSLRDPNALDQGNLGTSSSTSNVPEHEQELAGTAGTSSIQSERFIPALPYESPSYRLFFFGSQQILPLLPSPPLRVSDPNLETRPRLRPNTHPPRQL